MLAGFLLLIRVLYSVALFTIVHTSNPPMLTIGCCFCGSFLRFYVCITAPYCITCDYSYHSLRVTSTRGESEVRNLRKTHLISCTWYRYTWYLLRRVHYTVNFSIHRQTVMAILLTALYSVQQYVAVRVEAVSYHTLCKNTTAETSTRHKSRTHTNTQHTKKGRSFSSYSNF